MIGKVELNERVRAWGLREEVVEKDYVLGWVLWGIGADPLLSATWVFKGGTCLKKCYIDTYRFSEDLDFTVLESGPIEPDEVLETFHTTLCDRVPGNRLDSNAEVFQSKTYTPDETGFAEGSALHGDLLRLWEKVSKKSTEYKVAASQST